MALLEVGRVIKPHGLKGELVVELVTNRLERLAPGAQLSIEQAGDSVGLVVESSRPHQGRYLVVFQGVHGHAAAEALRNAVLYAEPVLDPDEIFVHELIGSEVYDQEGIYRGAVSSIEANPASDLLVLDTKHVVPIRFVKAHALGRIEVEVPDGLFDV